MLDWFRNWRRDRKTEQQRQQKLRTGDKKITSGVLSPGERQHLFRTRKK